MTDDTTKTTDSDVTHEITALAGGIVSAYVSNNSVPVSELPALIGSVHGALARLGGVASGVSQVQVPAARLSSAEIRRSVAYDGLVSFIDGKSYKTLKRHLTSHGLDPDSYRARFGLPADYPMVAQSYAEQRSALAKEIGLGRPGGLAERRSAA